MAAFQRCPLIDVSLHSVYLVIVFIGKSSHRATDLPPGLQPNLTGTGPLVFEGLDSGKDHTGIWNQDEEVCVCVFVCVVLASILFCSGIFSYTFMLFVK